MCINSQKLYWDLNVEDALVHLFKHFQFSIFSFAARETEVAASHIRQNITVCEGVCGTVMMK